MGQKKDLFDLTRNSILHFLLENLKDQSIPRGKIQAAADLFKVGRQSISRIWNSTKKQRALSQVINVERRKSTPRIRKKKHEMDFAKIEQIPVQERGTIRSMHDALGDGISRAIVGRWAKLLLIHHSNAIKPLLTAHHIFSRLQFSLQALHYDSGLNIIKFKAMKNTIHIDEKWFFLTRKNCSYYLTPMEADPLRAGESKQFIPKVMFLCAVSRPVFDVDGTILFNGKIRIWPLVEEIVPAIKQKWPSCLSKNIQIQQDNAKIHITNRDADFQEVANSNGFHIQLVNQPAKSPDCNANDLGFFCAIQALQQRKNCKNADELIDAVSSSFTELDAMTLNKVFLSLQQVMIEIMKTKGTNDFKQPHMNKDALIRQGMLPTNLEVPQFLVRESIDYLIGEERTQGIEGLMEAMGISVPHIGGGVPDMNA